jgi:hypothetical protein
MTCVHHRCAEAGAPPGLAFAWVAALESRRVQTKQSGKTNLIQAHVLD